MIKPMKKREEGVVVVKAPNFQRAEFKIVGISPYVQNRFSAKAQQIMRDKQEMGSQQAKAKKGIRDPKDFRECFEAATHKMAGGGYGIPAGGWRNVLIEACRTVGYTMTQAKCSIFVEEDGLDEEDGTPLVLLHGERQYSEMPVRLRDAKRTADIRPRPLWQSGWTTTLRVMWDADQFTLSDVANLIARAGVQVGIGEGRPLSPTSNGMGWGMFRLAEEGE